MSIRIAMAIDLFHAQLFFRKLYIARFPLPYDFVIQNATPCSYKIYTHQNSRPSVPTHHHAPNKILDIPLRHFLRVRLENRCF